jgi:DNA-binding transcriptional ArsR family regulator
MTENVIVLEPGDDRAKKIAKAISSQTASEILTLLRDKAYSSTQISDALKLPITTIQYHVENLLDAEMLEVIEKKWSKKGREVKVYGLRNQLVIVAPHTSDLRSMLMKYAAFFCFIAVISVIIAAVLPPLGIPQSSPAPMLGAERNVADSEAVKAFSTEGAAPAAEPIVTAAAFFFFGGFAVLFALMLYELVIRPRMTG